jgi:hypothetical protein
MWSMARWAFRRPASADRRRPRPDAAAHSGSATDSGSLLETLVPAARRRLFGELSVPGTIAFAAHFGDQPFGRIVDGGWSPVPSTVLPPPLRQLS